MVPEWLVRSDLKHIINSLEGVTPDMAPTDYTEDLFDGFAKHYDIDMVQRALVFMSDCVDSVMFRWISSISESRAYSGPRQIGESVRMHAR